MIVTTFQFFQQLQCWCKPSTFGYTTSVFTRWFSSSFRWRRPILAMEQFVFKSPQRYIHGGQNTSDAKTIIWLFSSMPSQDTSQFSQKKGKNTLIHYNQIILNFLDIFRNSETCKNFEFWYNMLSYLNSYSLHSNMRYKNIYVLYLEA